MLKLLMVLVARRSAAILPQRLQHRVEPFALQIADRQAAGKGGGMTTSATPPPARWSWRPACRRYLKQGQEPWRRFVNADGSISSYGIGGAKYWGPVGEQG